MKILHSVTRIADPHQSWLILRGLKTFAVRMEAHNRNAHAVAGSGQERMPRSLQAFA